MKYLSKGEGLVLLNKHSLPAIKFYYECDNLPKFENYSVRSSHKMISDSDNPFYRLNFSLPGRFFVKKDNLCSSIEGVRHEYAKAFGQEPEIIIHETLSLKYCGNIHINKIENLCILEVWDEYDKKQAPLFAEEIHSLNRDITVQGVNSLIPKEIFNLDFNEYILEWNYSEKDIFLFTELCILN